MPVLVKALGLKNSAPEKESVTAGLKTESTAFSDTGDVSGTLLTEKVFVVRSGSGKIRVPETVSGGMCKITTSTGDVSIQID